MEIILKQEVDNLGYKDQIVNVKPGYANNFLIPRGMATVATPSAKKAHSETLRQQAHKEAKMVSDAQTMTSKLEALSVVLTTKANESGKIFGSITSQDIAEAISAKGIEVDRRAIKVEAIKEIGTYTAQVKIYKEISATININIVAKEEKQ